MRWTLVVAVAAPCVACLGCAFAPPTVPPEAVTQDGLAWSGSAANPCFLSNPLFVAVRDPQCIWETVVDVVDDYFRIQSEEPARLIGATITEGRLETFAEPSATLFEPWRFDSVGAYERLESTLQSIRRRATVRVTPGEGGYWIDVAVFKELEDLPQPMMSTAGAATFRYDSSLVRAVEPVGQQDVTRGWIRYGRDDLLEQRILGHLQGRLAGVGAPIRLSSTQR
jgi:hypothetical protein